MTKKLENRRIRLAIITEEILPSQLPYANERDLIDYLSYKRRKELNIEAEKILRIAENEDMKLHFEKKEEKELDSQTDTDEKTTIGEKE